jgi:hypothetical protein
MLGGALFLICLIWSEHSSTVGVNTTKLFPRAIQLAIQIGLIVFPVTLLANVFGYLNFANLLGAVHLEARTLVRPCMLRCELSKG